ncbi:MAG: hypothetical protein NT150_02415 [Bacteroidetes bacterium]|nr:hypothetical protein [Bacteroidota bacterium]
MKYFLFIALVLFGLSLRSQNLLTSDPKQLENYYKITFKKITISGFKLHPSMYGEMPSEANNRIIEKINDEHYLVYDKCINCRFYDTTIYNYDKCGNLIYDNLYKIQKKNKYVYGTNCEVQEIQSKEIKRTYRDSSVYSSRTSYFYKNGLLEKELKFYFKDSLPAEQTIYLYEDSLLVKSVFTQLMYGGKNTVLITKYKYENGLLVKESNRLNKSTYKYDDEGLIREISWGYLGYSPMTIFYSNSTGKMLPYSLVVGSGKSKMYFFVKYE